jgi:virginiamycin B lyase
MFWNTKIRSAGTKARALLLGFLAVSLPLLQGAYASAAEDTRARGAPDAAAADTRCVDMRLRAEASRADSSGSESGLDSMRRSPGLILRKDPPDDIPGPPVTFAISEFAVPAAVEADPKLSAVAAGADGSLYIADSANHRILQMRGATNFRTFRLAADVVPSGLTLASDGAIWFTDANDRIGRLSPCGFATEYDLPTAGSHPYRIVEGPDGNFWFTEYDGNRIGRVTKKGEVTEFSIPTAESHPAGIAVGADGNLWFTESGAGRIGRIDLDGKIVEFSLPRPDSRPLGIAAADDGAVWFVENAANRIGRIDVYGSVFELALSSRGAAPFAIVSAADGTLWFSESGLGRIGRLTLLGEVRELATPTAGSIPLDLAVGADSSIWFSEEAGAVGRIQTLRRGPKKPQDGD